MDDFDIKIKEYKTVGSPYLCREYIFDLYDVKIVRRVTINFETQHSMLNMGINYAAYLDKIARKEIKKTILNDIKLMRKIKLNKIKKIYDT